MFPQVEKRRKKMNGEKNKSPQIWLFVSLTFKNWYESHNQIISSNKHFMKADLETFHVPKPSRFPIACLAFLARILGAEIILIIKGRGLGTGRLMKQGFVRTEKHLSASQPF